MFGRPNSEDSKVQETSMSDWKRSAAVVTARRAQGGASMKERDERQGALMTTGAKMSSKDPKRVRIERAFLSYKADTLDAYLDLYHPEVKLHFVSPGLPNGREGSRLRDLALLAGFPDGKVIFEDWIIEGDRVATRFRFEGTHLGEFMGVAPTRKRVSVAGITIMRFEGNYVVERWSEMNYLGLFQALGVSLL